jgi:hypothetical protein
MKVSIALKTLLGTAALTLPLVASAASTYTTGTAALSATAQVDFSVVIPKILYLRVGAGSAYTTGALSTVNTVDLITFSPAVGSVGNGTAVAGTGGDLTGGVETAAVVSNSGNVTRHSLGRAQRRQWRFHPVHPDRHGSGSEHRRLHAVTGTRAEQWHEFDGHLDGTGVEDHHRGCKVDFQLRELGDRARRHVRRCQHQ